MTTQLEHCTNLPAYLEEYVKAYPAGECINVETVRLGEWNEAICFTYDYHVRTEIAAQKSKDGYWNIFFVSSRSALTLASGLSRDKAYQLASYLSGKILKAAYPAKEARRWSGQ